MFSGSRSDTERVTREHGESDTRARRMIRKHGGRRGAAEREKIEFFFSSEMCNGNYTIRLRKVAFGKESTDGYS